MTTRPPDDSVPSRPREPGSGHAVSNPTARVVAIIDYLAAHPDESFGATALARILDISKSTCLAILTTLTDTGYLIQHPGRRDYRIGPGLITAGRSALSRFHDLSSAHAVMAASAAELGMSISAATIADDQIVVVDLVGHSDPFRGVERIGVRVPFEPPYGAIFVGWAGPEKWNRWIGATDPELTAAQVATLRAAVQAARDRGFFVLLDLPPDHRLRPVQEEMRHLDRQLRHDDFKRLGAERLMGENYFARELQADRTYVVSHLQAPLLLSPAQAPLALDALAMGRTMTGSEILASGRKLVELARRVAVVLGN